MKPQYERRIVAFVDMLGISDRLLSTESEAFARTIHTVISALTGKKPTVFFVLPHVPTNEEVEIQFDKPLGGSDRMTTLSDAVVMSFPAEEQNNQFAPGSKSLPILRALEAVFWLQRGLLTLGVRTRGGICRGELFHTGAFIFGEAMVRAYRLESRTAVYPRAAVDEELIEVLLSEPIPNIALFSNRVAHAVRIDRDGQYFVDYLGYDPLQGDFGMKRHHTTIPPNLEVRNVRTAWCISLCTWRWGTVRTCSAQWLSVCGFRESDVRTLLDTALRSRCWHLEATGVRRKSNSGILRSLQDWYANRSPNRYPANCLEAL